MGIQTPLEVCQQSGHSEESGEEHEETESSAPCGLHRQLYLYLVQPGSNYVLYICLYLALSSSREQKLPFIVHILSIYKI